MEKEAPPITVRFFNVPEHLQEEFLAAIDALYRSMGGDGLVITRMETPKCLRDTSLSVTASRKKA